MCGVNRDGNGKETEKWISEISESVSMRIRSVSILGGGNWKETGKQISEISESVFIHIRSISILSCEVQEIRGRAKKGSLLLLGSATTRGTHYERCFTV